MKRVAIIGGGAAGFFTAICLKEQNPGLEVDIFEKKQRVLAKVEVSGGGRCNCTNTFASISSDLHEAYPRGHRLMKRLMKGFSQRDAYAWFERHGVKLTVQPDGCVFPASQSSLTIVNCFMAHARKLGVNIRTGYNVQSWETLEGFQSVVVTTGGTPRAEGLSWLKAMGHDIVPPVPSLFSLRIDDEVLHSLMGTVVPHVVVMIPGEKMRAEGPLLFTHWGISGPAVLKLSSYAARLLNDRHYQTTIAVNWTCQTGDNVLSVLRSLSDSYPQRLLTTVSPCGLPARLWACLAERCLGERYHATWGSLNQKQMNRLANQLSGGDTYITAGRAPFRDEFVTCGGVSLASVNPVTLESRHVPNLYFAGEVLDIDGITGGFNFQAAWTTAFIVAQAISKTIKENT
jgi:hypothetical protein